MTIEFLEAAEIDLNEDLNGMMLNKV